MYISTCLQCTHFIINTIVLLKKRRCMLMVCSLLHTMHQIEHTENREQGYWPIKPIKLSRVGLERSISCVQPPCVHTYSTILHINLIKCDLSVVKCYTHLHKSHFAFIIIRNINFWCASLKRATKSMFAMHSGSSQLDTQRKEEEEYCFLPLLSLMRCCHNKTRAHK